MRELFKLRNYRIYLLGSTVDSIGDSAFFLAAMIWVKELTGSTAQGGLTIMALTLGTLLSPVTGILVDRLPRKKTLMVTNALTALMLLSLTTVHRPSQVWMIIVAMFLYGVSGDISYSAFSGLKEQLMPKELFGDASGLSQAIQQGSRLVTPAIGLGLLSAFGGPTLAVVDACTFVVALIAWSLIKIDDPKPARPEKKQSWVEESTAGFRFLFRSTLLLQLTVACAVGIFAMGFFEVLGVAISTQGLHHSPTFVGVIVTVMGVTGLIGGLTAGAVLKRIGCGMLAASGLIITGLSTFGLAVPNQYVVLGSILPLGLALPWLIVGANTAIQLYTPNGLMGRVNGVINLIITGSQSIGIAVCAWLIAFVFYRDLCYFVAITMALGGLYLASRPTQWKRNLPPLESEQTGASSSEQAEAASEQAEGAEPVPTSALQMEGTPAEAPRLEAPEPTNEPTPA